MMKTTLAGFGFSKSTKCKSIRWHDYQCHHCGEQLARNEMILLRDRYALPEESTLYFHASCAEEFVLQNGESWKSIPRNSAEAGWLLT